MNILRLSNDAYGIKTSKIDVAVITPDLRVQIYEIRRVVRNPDGRYGYSDPTHEQIELLLEIGYEPVEEK